MTAEEARTFAEHLLRGHAEVGAVRRLPGDKVIQVMVDYERVTSWTQRRVDLLAQILQRRGFNVVMTPSGESQVLGLPDKKPGVRRRPQVHLLTAR